MSAPTDQRLKGLGEGAAMLVVGLRLLVKRRDWWPVVLAPLALFLVFLVLSLLMTLQVAPDVVSWALPLVGGGPARRLAATVVVWCGVLASFSLLSWLGAKASTGPFFDVLSQRVESEFGPGLPQPPLSWSDIGADALRGMTHTLLATTLYLSLSCPLVLLQIIPGVGQVAGLTLGSLLSALYLTREVLDYPMSRRRWSFRAKLAWIRSHLPSSIGFGLSLVLLLMIPVLNLLAMPAAVIGATRLFEDLEVRRS